MAWWFSVNSLDVWTVAMILVAAGIYLSALVATGAVLFRLAFPRLPDHDRRRVARMGVLSAWAGVILILFQWSLEAGYLGGGNIAAATNPMLLGIVFDGASGGRLILVVAGLLLVQAIQLNNLAFSKTANSLSLVGVLLVMLAFVQVGHTVNTPRLVLAVLLIVHLMAAAFWVASLWPLFHLVGQHYNHGNTARILTRFGQLAMGGVGVLVLAGVTLATLLTGGLTPLLTTAYGQFLIGKVLIVAVLLLFAAANKWRLVPAFESGDATAPRRLQRSIALEVVLVVVILLITAVLTRVTSPNG
ncbi:MULTISPECIES: copper resistance D family protein [Halomonadaceae]|uniref:Copper resistance protein D n=3 Tax=Oceanospirillales TaxID=135619 RepID=A0A558J0L5_9GAMM|nr:CopD family protein [Halovibrio sp. HP20-59]MBL1267740.1 CopD family protein [Halomonas sp.]MCD1587364.1 CopD family protein [Halomonas sp. IOP_14]QNU63150.1 CopD family protein [Halomonas titanicae]CDG53840.1 Copper resistance D domain-containing protein [Halomonas sp. A3H3]MEA2118729.1 CopD family protein [Halovibrio sp. HP20-59]